MFAHYCEARMEMNEHKPLSEWMLDEIIGDGK